jgi:hypothetical protein
MPALVAGIHVLRPPPQEDVDGRDKPGHDRIADSIQSANALEAPARRIRIGVDVDER